MILDPPRILELCIRLLKPLTRLDSILARTHKRNNSLRVVTSRVVNRLQKDIIQAIDLSTMLSRSTRDLVDWFKSHHLALASQLGTNLEPQLAESLFGRGNVGAGRREIGPDGCVVMHVDKGVQATRGHHVDDVGDALEPCGIDFPVWCCGVEMVRPCHGYANAFVARSFDVVKGAAHDGGIVPVALVLYSIERVADIPAWVEFGEESSCRKG